MPGKTESWVDVCTAVGLSERETANRRIEASGNRNRVTMRKKEKDSRRPEGAARRDASRIAWLLDQPSVRSWSSSLQEAFGLSKRSPAPGGPLGSRCEPDFTQIPSTVPSPV